MQTLLIPALVVVLGLLLPALGLTQERPLRVGIIAPFSGSAQIYGAACRNGFELALDELGRSRLAVQYEDDQFLPAKTVAAFHKLNSGAGVDVIITTGSTPSSAVAPLAQARNLPLIAWASDTRVAQGRPLVLRSYPSGFTEGAVTAAEVSRRDYRKTVTTRPLG